MSKYLKEVGFFLHEFCRAYDILDKTNEANFDLAADLLVTQSWAQVVHVYRVVLRAEFDINTYLEFQKFLFNCNRHIFDIKDLDLDGVADFCASLANYIKPFDGRGDCKIPMARTQENFLNNLKKRISRKKFRLPILPAYLEVNSSRVSILAKEFPVLFGDGNKDAKSLAGRFNSTIELLNKEIWNGDFNIIDIVSNLKKNANVSIGEPMTPDSMIEPEQRSRSKFKPRPKPILKQTSKRPAFEQPVFEQSEREQSESEQSESEQSKPRQLRQLTPREERLKNDVRILGWLSIGGGIGTVISYKDEVATYCTASNLPKYLQKAIADTPKYERLFPHNLLDTTIEYAVCENKWLCAKKNGKKAYYAFPRKDLGSKIDSPELGKWLAKQEKYMVECERINKVVEDSDDAPDDEET